MFRIGPIIAEVAIGVSSNTKGKNLVRIEKAKGMAFWAVRSKKSDWDFIDFVIAGSHEWRGAAPIFRRITIKKTNFRSEQ